MKKTLSLITGVAIMSLGVAYLAIAWTEPASAPPESNIPAPLNTSINAQSKEGALVIGTNSGLTTGLVVQYGNVGIGTTNPEAKLEVSGNAKISGILDMNSQKITSVSSPTENADAATKGYVDAQASSGGGETLITWGSARGGTQVHSIIPAGTGSPSCPSGWTEVYAGYGPFSFLETVRVSEMAYGVANSSDICKNSGTDYGPGIMSPCTIIHDNYYGDYYAGCNTCRVCVKN